MNKFNDYQDYIANKFRKYPDAGQLTERSLSYLILKLNGEAGEVAEKYGKLLRDNGGNVTPEFKAAMSLELGDVQWYISEISAILGFQLSEIADLNIAKLDSRDARGVMGGSGDNR